MFICIITYNRPKALRQLLADFGARKIPWNAIVDDSSTRPPVNLRGDETSVYDKKLDSDVVELEPGRTLVLGRKNVGIAGNLNRALYLFSLSNLDTAAFCYDDAMVQEDFRACKGTQLSVDNACIVLSKRCLAEIGYFDTAFGKFTQSHEVNDYAQRARLAGVAVKNTVAAASVKIRPNCEPALSDFEKAKWSEFAQRVLQARPYQNGYTPTYRQFTLQIPRVIGANSVGLSARLCQQVNFICA